MILRQNNLDLTSRFMVIKSKFSKLTQKQIAQQLGFSDTTIKRYREKINMPCPYRKKTRKKMSSQDGSVTEEGGNFESLNEFFSGKDLNDKVFNNN